MRCAAFKMALFAFSKKHETLFRLKGVLRDFVVFFTPAQVLIDGIFEVLLGTFNRLSLKRNGVVHIGNPSEKEGCLLIKSEGSNIVFIGEHDLQYLLSKCQFVGVSVNLFPPLAHNARSF